MPSFPIMSTKPGQAHVAAWMAQTYPAIARRAKTEWAEIRWGDETGVRSDCQHGCS